MHRSEREVQLSERHGTAGQEIDYWGVVVQVCATLYAKCVHSVLPALDFMRGCWCLGERGCPVVLVDKDWPCLHNPRCLIACLALKLGYGGGRPRQSIIRAAGR